MTQPAATTPVPLEKSISAFQTFSGMVVPSAAKQVDLRVVQDPSGVSAYRVDFTLPSSQADAYCAAGQLGVPLDVYTVPPSIAEQFGYDAAGADPRGVKVAEGALPKQTNVQRTVLATGTDTATAQVRTYAYAQAR